MDGVDRWVSRSTEGWSEYSWQMFHLNLAIVGVAVTILALCTLL